MARRFWRGFAAGAATGAGAGIGGFLLISSITGQPKQHVVRLEKSLQIGRPVSDVFDAWANLERLPLVSDYVQSIHRDGKRSHWVIQMDGRTLEWDAEIQQFIPNQAIGWKTLSGPKHTGRITFSPIGSDTLVQVTMNYSPPSRVLKPFVENTSGLLERYIEQVLRDFKSALEGKGQEGRRPAVRSAPVGPGAEMTQSDASRATGTFGTTGSATTSSPNEVVDRFANRPNPADYTSLPEAKR